MIVSSGDIISQKFIEKRKKLNFKRISRAFFIGFSINSLNLFFWYNRILPNVLNKISKFNISKTNIIFKSNNFLFLKEIQSKFLKSNFLLRIKNFNYFKNKNIFKNKFFSIFNKEVFLSIILTNFIFSPYTILTTLFSLNFLEVN